MWLEDVALESTHVKLMPLVADHADQLVAAASDGDLWSLWYTSVPNQDSVESYIAFALDQKSKGLSLPFVVIDKNTNNVIGTTRYCNADTTNHRVEIGYTWYAKSYQRTSINTECKMLLLQHAFEKIAAIAFEFRTSWFNYPSREAIARLGAKQDGILRQHQKLPNGSYRDTVVFSILDSEWAGVKVNLEYRLQKYKS
ncbi:MAG: GNAT family N-acetyltransferase [Gammaproteobacteria bacterium]|nr:GNAT family N-acetyltransferase [Gammaproteobacteria bacterium]HBF06819.1 GNAT family N-acetyltransferase [Gammaproteobacteria bacterium]|tara:strand:+ start:10934 stop:11527 length:594 start_codon:yes stop_codon:yes gene_type:complete